ncbi:DegT/DnrJ/EryC1/StrS family aminotransferase [Thalassospira povalilytica]|uniref:DegT/DnrJ/EryC1/StrS family aminotransferase n=2 Tax=Thalassospira TaxID=168934 RepID=A0A8I1M8Z6_9PROT|nr:DegT/DnrJ/EryC1/StrS family aminotransferase [Thalassospira povalilytica]MBN8197298.1 DegT/DnrJ/EryC1/StrS family aminotransferase [Thalassospira povalilytica]
MFSYPAPKKRVISRVTDLERRYVMQCLDYGFETSKGSEFCTRLERAFADYHGMEFAISFMNGTCTMHAALEAAGVGPGDEVIVPPLTMSSTTFVVLQAHAVPVFADVDPDTFQIDPMSIRERVTERTKAIIPVALYGLSPDMDAIMQIAKEHDLIVIEDDAEAITNTYKGRKIGTVGHVSSFSFQSSKHLTAGEGGMILTNDEALANSIRRFNSLGYAGVGSRKGKITKTDIQDPAYSRHVSTGFNYRMPELCAAVALAQLERIDELVQRRIDVGNLFNEVTAQYQWFVSQKTPSNCTNSYWTFVAKLEHPDVSWHEFRDAFLANGGDGVYAAWKLSYMEPMFANGCPLTHPAYKGIYQKFGPGLCPNAEMVQPKLFQFKTNYWNWDDAEEQAQILRKTLSQFS